MYGEWLPGSGYQPDDAPAIESYVGDPGGSPARKGFVFDLCIPVKPL
jgi:DNA gyrase inhibitor GyrI